MYFEYFRGVQNWIFSLKIKINRKFWFYGYSSIKVYINTFVFNLVFFYVNSCLSTQRGAFAFIFNIFERFKSEYFPLKWKEKSIKIALFVIWYFFMKIHIWAHMVEPLDSFLIFSRGKKSEFFSLKSEFRLYIYSSIKVYKYTFVFNLVLFYQISCLCTQGGVFAFISKYFQRFKSEYFPLKSKEIVIFLFIYTRLSKSINIPLSLI